MASSTRVIQAAILSMPASSGRDDYDQGSQIRYTCHVKRNLAMSLTQFKLLIALAFAATVAPFSAMATEAGMVKTVSGTVRIERNGLAIPALVGTPVEAQDRVVTGSDGSVGLTLKDDTLLSAGPNSVLALNRFAFNSTTNEGSISLQVLKGTLRAVSGLIARQSPGSLEVKTRTATVGIRGTDFIIEVPAND